MSRPLKTWAWTTVAGEEATWGLQYCTGLAHLITDDQLLIGLELKKTNNITKTYLILGKMFPREFLFDLTRLSFFVYHYRLQSPLLEKGRVSLSCFIVSAYF